MQSKISTPVAIVIIVVVLAIAGFALWRSQAAKSGNVLDEKGIPLPPPEARGGFNAMQDLYKKGTMPPKTQPGQ